MRIPSSDSDTRLWPHHAQCCLIATPLKFWSARLYRPRSVHIRERCQRRPNYPQAKGTCVMFCRLSIAAGFALALCGCITAEQQASLAEPPKPITCHSGNDCNAKWSRANAWVAEHSKYKVESSSESLIQTSGPSTFETDPSPSYKVTKVATGPAEYSIEFTGACDSIFPCTPTVPVAQADFTQSLQTAQPPPEPRKKKKERTYQTSSR
jgi:hypothetical protein